MNPVVFLWPLLVLLTVFGTACDDAPTPTSEPCDVHDTGSGTQDMGGEPDVVDDVGQPDTTDPGLCGGVASGAQSICKMYCEEYECCDTERHFTPKCQELLMQYSDLTKGQSPPCCEPLTPPEVCNGKDDDGDGKIDEDFDLDGDGIVRCCEPEEFFITRNDAGETLMWTVDANGAFVQNSMPLFTNPDLGVGSIADFNADGALDVITIEETMVNGNPAWIHRSTSCVGSWETVDLGTFERGYASALDANGDGHLDLMNTGLIHDSSGRNQPNPGLVALGDGLLNFTELAGSIDLSSIVPKKAIEGVAYPSDLNGDGVSDLIFSTYATSGAGATTVYVQLGAASGLFTPPVMTATVPQIQNHGDMGDVDGDGCADWVGGADDDGDKGAVFALFGDCQGGLANPKEIVDVCDGCATVGSWAGVSFNRLYDADQDGDLDLFARKILNSNTTPFVYALEYYSNDGTGQFSGPTVIIPSYSGGVFTPFPG